MPPPGAWCLTVPDMPDVFAPLFIIFVPRQVVRLPPLPRPVAPWSVYEDCSGIV